MIVWWWWGGGAGRRAPGAGGRAGGRRAGWDEEREDESLLCAWGARFHLPARRERDVDGAPNELSCEVHQQVERGGGTHAPDGLKRGRVSVRFSPRACWAEKGAAGGAAWTRQGGLAVPPGANALSARPDTCVYNANAMCMPCMHHHASAETGLLGVRGSRSRPAGALGHWGRMRRWCHPWPLSGAKGWYLAGGGGWGGEGPGQRHIHQLARLSSR